MSRPRAERQRRAQLRANGTWPTCRFCGADIRTATVLVGPRSRQRAVLLSIDRWPHPDGIVIRRRDGQYQMLKPGLRAREGSTAFRVHSERECGTGVPRTEPAGRSERQGDIGPATSA